MGERMDRAMAKLDAVLNGPEPEPPPQPFYGRGELSTDRPVPAVEDLYLRPGGGFGSRSEDELEAKRQASELRASGCQARGAKCGGPGVPGAPAHPGARTPARRARRTSR